MEVIQNWRHSENGKCNADPNLANIFQIELRMWCDNILGSNGLSIYNLTRKGLIG